jgi:hypothetical protein
MDAHSVVYVEAQHRVSAVHERLIGLELEPHATDAASPPMTVKSAAMRDFIEGRSSVLDRSVGAADPDWPSL